MPLAPVVVGGPDPKASGTAGGIELSLRGIGLVLNIITDQINKQRTQEALSEREGDIVKHAVKNPHEGTLVVLTYHHLPPHPDSVVSPKPVFDHLRIYHGRNLTAAKAAWHGTPEISRAPGAGREIVTELIWIPPVDPKPVKAGDLAVPFRRTALGTFRVGPEYGIHFRNVEWGGVTGFDDSGVESFGGDDVDPDSLEAWLVRFGLRMTLPFYVLEPPKQIRWSYGGRLMTTEIPIVTRKAADGSSIKVINLDPQILGDVTVVPVFPASDDAMRFFREHVPELDDTLNLLRGIPNVHLLRFVEPRYLELTERL